MQVVVAVTRHASTAVALPDLQLDLGGNQAVVLELLRRVAQLG
jgi:hypothetical protein